MGGSDSHLQRRMWKEEGIAAGRTGDLAVKESQWYVILAPIAQLECIPLVLSNRFLPGHTADNEAPGKASPSLLVRCLHCSEPSPMASNPSREQVGKIHPQ